MARPFSPSVHQSMDPQHGHHELLRHPRPDLRNAGTDGPCRGSGPDYEKSPSDLFVDIFVQVQGTEDSLTVVWKLKAIFELSDDDLNVRRAVASQSLHWTVGSLLGRRQYLELQRRREFKKA